MRKIRLIVLTAILLFTVMLSVTTFAAETERTVRVGWITHAGLQNYENGVFSGYTYEYLMEMANYTGWTYEFVPGKLTEILEKLRNGEVDIVGGLLPTEECRRLYEIPNNEYGHAYISLFATQESNLEPYDFESFDGMRVGAVENATANLDSFAAFSKENNFTYTIDSFPDVPSLANAVLAKKIDAGVVGLYQANSDIKILSEFSPSPLYFAITKGNTEVLSGVNKAIARIRIENPYLETELYKKYFMSLKSVKLTDSEQAVVAASVDKPITIGVIDSSAPLFYMDSKTGEYSGIAIDMLKLSAEKTGLVYQFVPADLSRAGEAKTPTTASPKVVVGITSMESLPDSRNWFLSDVIINDSLVLVSKQGEDIISEPSSKTLAIMGGFTMAKNYAARYFPEYKIMECLNLEECLNAIVKGEADGTLYLRSCVNYLLQKPLFEKLEIIPSFTDEIDTHVAAFTDENKILIRILNKGFNMISDEESRNITLDYTVMNPYRLTMGDTIYKYRIPLVVIVLLVLIIIAFFVLLFITKQRSSEKLKKAYEQEKAALILAEQASAAKGNFMSRMSHEIRTPLNAVIGYNTIARNELTEAKTEAERKQAMMKAMDCLMKSDIASKHLLTIINDVLDMSAIESGKIKVLKERFDFKGLISSLTAIFYSQAKAKDVGFEVLFENQTDEWLIGDQMRVNQVLTNLLSNAIKFTSEGGSVVLTIKQKIVENSACIDFEVKDTGIGMTEEYLEHIWTPFEQANSSISRRFGGSGLGLSITKTLVDLMKGTIEVNSAPGKGSTFKVNLTFARTEEAEEMDTYDFGSINALIIDDDTSTCDYIRLLLTRCGVRSAAVTSGHAALETITQAIESKDPYTMCLVDWHMPKMDGVETIKKIREIVGKELPIIVLTAYDYSEIADKAGELGVNMFISKPLFQSSLFNLLANISGKRLPEKLKRNISHDFNGARVLLVEDNLMNMEIAYKMLESAGLAVDCAYNGQEAVSMFEKDPTGYKAILMDMQMPVMDGHEATRTIRASKCSEGATIPIIAMTADAFAENVAEAMASGMNAHIAKPLDIPLLFDTLERYIKKD